MSSEAGSASLRRDGAPRRGLRLPSIAFLISRPLSWLALGSLVLSAVLPAHGLGVWSCTFHELTGRPCVGCGMTRGVTAISHADLDRAWDMHPFAFAFWPLALILALGVHPTIGAVWQRLARRHDRLLSWIFWTGTAAFLAFGILRLVLGARFFPDP